MGLFSKRKTVALPQLSDTVFHDLETAVYNTADCAGSLLRFITSNPPLITYIQTALVPKLVKPAMRQDFAGVAAILKADPVVGPLAEVALKAFNEGFANV